MHLLKKKQNKGHSMCLACQNLNVFYWWKLFCETRVNLRLTEILLKRLKVLSSSLF